jgi:response regulator RpfG family c-di-GMP phosphodiesterase
MDTMIAGTLLLALSLSTFLIFMAIFKTENLCLLDVGASSDRARARIMIVDDMDANVSVMATILRPYFEVIEARDGNEALRLIQQLGAEQPLACLISDHRMPRMSGVQLFERVLPLLPDTRRILVTGYLDIEALIDAVNKGQIHRFVAKPFDAHDFLLTVRCAAAAFEASTQAQAYQATMVALAGEPPPHARALLANSEAATQELLRLEAELQQWRSGDGGLPHDLPPPA